MMPIKFDWKFLLPLIVSVLGFVIPMMWSWYGEANSLSLKIQLLSIAALDPPNGANLEGITVTIDGAPVVKPYLSVLEITNDGNKPIPASAFESPIEIASDQNSFIARAQVTHVIPDELQAKISWKKNSIAIEPLLLNPGDAITVAVVTSNSKPVFSTRSRIAGIHKIKEVDASEKITAAEQKASFYLIGASILLIFVSFLAADANLKPLTGSRYTFVVMVNACIGGVLMAIGLQVVGFSEIGRWVLLSPLSLIVLIWGVNSWRESKQRVHEEFIKKNSK